MNSLPSGVSPEISQTVAVVSDGRAPGQEQQETLQQQRELPALVASPPQNPFAGFDPHAGTNWLYPVDFVTPDYIPLIAEKTLYHNSLIILPNNFEKSFITAVTMYNIYRWYPLGKVVYVAPKRTLVADQRTACERFMKFLPADVAEMAMKPNERTRYWVTKRVFFITSYMMHCDMNRAAQEIQILDKIKLVIIDEPQIESRLHTKIIQKLVEGNQNIRIICVSTTSGKTVEAGLLKQWMISNIELQWGNPHETPEDWLLNKKDISNIPTPPGPSLSALLGELKEISQRYTRNLHVSKSISKVEFDCVTIDHMRQERIKYERSILTGVLRKNHHNIMLNFHMAEKLLLAYRILQRDGIVALLEFFHRESDIFVQGEEKLMAFLQKLRQGVYNTPHPKFRTLENFLGEFFQRRQDARILIVVERLDAALVIHQGLQDIPQSKHKVLIDSNYLQDVELFRTGQLNVLIVTIQIEPVIDFGDTDLIVLFNMTDQPREFLAHIARTRGANPGAIVILTTEGPEQHEIADIISTRRMYYYENRNILPIGVDLSNMMMRSSPSLIPHGFQPKGRQIFFNVSASEQSPADQVKRKSSSPQAGEKRKVLEVLSTTPAAYDVVNGQTYYEVVPIKQQQHLEAALQNDQPKTEVQTVTFIDG